MVLTIFDLFSRIPKNMVLKSGDTNLLTISLLEIITIFTGIFYDYSSAILSKRMILIVVFLKIFLQKQNEQRAPLLFCNRSQYFLLYPFLNISYYISISIILNWPYLDHIYYPS